MGESITIKRLLKILQRRFLVVISVFVVISGSTIFAVTYLMKTTYEANEYIFIGDLQNESKDFYEENQKINRMVASSIDFINSPIVSKEVLKKNNLKSYDFANQLVVTNTKESQIIKITITGEDPKLVKNLNHSIATTSVEKMSEILNFENAKVLSSESTLSSSSNQTLGSAIGCVIALFLAIGVAIVRESFDETIKDPEGLEIQSGLVVISKVNLKKKNRSWFLNNKVNHRNIKEIRGDLNHEKEKDKNLQAIK
ncbi:YveK family protein [Guptibacillus hwajinpoensis]|uniref:YveK family protein n=1 Tax=Guptibacillus hwajinpoensis TaxID=208199 RepID=UPI001CD73886|nr:Wzz/FepE/Etk N-terminal domain-containing protein [Pseudalkalibacillus hwajinpoensis]MCA0991435.1 hypothetical protein [Pseudalkalibacillus hwajinpoensis]